ncbi:hypothetical protein GJ697_25220 [Pseudoduganella sp. FT25W]|uniref:DUF4124 domain-containing protein n=1 Tax=Duganella alba TaxID=2666081 RepID=A0A6L5QMW7_9BURK|nr:hypothetical protein [Duganella alba]MRX19259.1 hypothetical protein [Duganella alba]
MAKPAAFTVVFLFGMLVCEYAWADQATDDYAKLPVCTLSADGTRLAVEPCRTAPAQRPMPRRPVPQIIDRMPQQKRVASVKMPAMTPTLSSPPRAPVPVTNCDAAGCYGTNGVRYNNAGGGVVGPSGKACTRAGATIQC